MDSKMQRAIREETLRLLLNNVKSCNDLKVVSNAIKDYESDGTDYSEYKREVESLRRGCM